MRSIPNTGIISVVDNDLGHVLIGSTPSGGANLPTTASIYAAGCRIVDRSTSLWYVNVGTLLAPIWALDNSSATVDPKLLQMIEVDQTAAQLILTGSGQMSDTTNGLTVVPAAPAGFVNVFHRMVVSYKFLTAAFTGGGNTTVNIGAGGAALSGLIATGSLWQSASSVVYEFKPLTTVATPMTAAAGISLKTASAITNPGTAAGSAKIYCWYSQVPI